MALNDVPLNDAGRDYYTRQFGDRIQKIRKNGATPTTARKSGCLGVGGGIFAVIVLLRIIAAVATVGSSSYNNYNTYEAPAVTIPDPPPAVEWQNNLQVDPPVDPNMPNFNPPDGQPDQPIILPPLDPPAVLPPDDPLLRPDPPPIPGLNPPPLPGDDKPDDDGK